MAQINNDLETLKTARDNMKIALEEKGQTVTKDIRTYAEAISNISTGGSGDVKLFDTIEHMQEDTSAKGGDLAVVYREETQPINEDSEFNSCIFPNIVVLEEAFISEIYGSFGAVGRGVRFDGNVEISSSNFSFDGWGSSEITVQYESQDGITYTRTDGGDELQEFETIIKYEPMEPWNDVIGKFMKIGGNYFDGMFEYKNSKEEDYLGILDNISVDTENYTISSTNTITYIQDFVNKIKGCNQNIGGAILKLNDRYFLQHIYSYYLYCDINNNTVCLDISENISATTSTEIYELDFVNNSMTKIADLSYSKIVYLNNSGAYARVVEPYLNADIVCFWQGDTQTIRKNFDIRPHNNGNYVSTEYTNKIQLGIIPFYHYTYISNQLNATSDFVYEKTFYSKNGVKNGTLTTSVNNSFTDVNAEVYAKIQAQYDNMQPRVVTDQDKDIDSDIRIIPSRSDGTSLLDTSNVTDMSNMFSSCRNLINISLLDTSNATNMKYMFIDCENLITVPNFNTLNVTNMYGIFNGCKNLTIVPNFNTSNVTDMQYMFSDCNKLTTVPNLDTSNVTNMQYMFSYCKNLTTVPNFNTSKVTNMYYMFNSCNNLSNESLNNILAMCVNSALTANKKLKYIGLTQEQATTCTTLSNYQALVNAGWTTGY